MKAKDIQDLIDFIAQSGLEEVNVETNELKLNIKRSSEVTVSAAPVAVAAPVAAPAVAAASVVESATPAAPAPKDDSAQNLVPIKSPILGTFYRAPKPEDPPFLSVGDKVTKGQKVCIVEAMKIFNEIESEVEGTVVKVLMENASPVEYDQVLFLVDPS